MNVTPMLHGQGEEFDRLLVAAAARRMPHGVVIEGSPGTGKSTAAILIAEALLGGGDEGSQRRVATGNHPDLHLVTRPEDKQDIPVERVRELQGELERTPVEGRARVAIIDPADRLNEQGQNALLKTLEEPGRDTFLLLVTSRPEALLETVRSRAARLRIRPLEADQLRAALAAGADVDPERLTDAVERAAGSLGYARQLLDDGLRELDEALVAFLTAPAGADPGLARALLQGVSGRTAVEARIRAVLGLLGGRLRVRLRRCLAEEGKQGYFAGAAERHVRAIETLLEAYRDLESGIPPAQVLDGALLGLVDSGVA